MKLSITTILLIMTLLVVPAIAAISSMNADGFSTGTAVEVNFDPYNPAAHYLRLNPANALGDFDAVQSSSPSTNAKFFALAAFTWIEYTFPDIFWNVDGEPDIRFSEVTWNNYWHPEAAKVYLTDAYVKDENGNIVPYGTTDDGIGYYAGTIWNKIGLNEVTSARRLEITESYFAGSRDFQNNMFSTDENFAISDFYMPDEVIYASGIYLVDITNEVYQEGLHPETYENVGPDDNGFSLHVESTEPFDVSTPTGGVDGNTDGYDLDAIRVWVMDGGIQELYSICGYKYFADTETGLEGWTIYLDKYDVAEGTWDNNFKSCLTASDGSYCFTELEAGIYRVREELQNGWTQVKVEGDAATNFVVLTSGSEGNNFYNTYTCSSDETAWTSGTRYVTNGNWATYTPYNDEAQTVKIYAGQTIYIGYATFSAPVDEKVTISINLNTGATFSDVQENLKIEGYADQPSTKNPVPGKFAYKNTFSGSSGTVIVPKFPYYGIHLDVKVPCQ